MIHPERVAGPLRRAGAPLLSLVLLCALGTPARGQSGGIETFAGETLFESGTRFSLSWLGTRRDELLAGSDGVPDFLEIPVTGQRIELLDDPPAAGLRELRLRVEEPFDAHVRARLAPRPQPQVP